MDYRKYRACLAGVIAVALVCGVILFARFQKESRIPAEGTLVEYENEAPEGEITIHIQNRDGIEIWA